MPNYWQPALGMGYRFPVEQMLRPPTGYGQRPGQQPPVAAQHWNYPQQRLAQALPNYRPPALGMGNPPPPGQISGPPTDYWQQTDTQPPAAAQHSYYSQQGFTQTIPNTQPASRTGYQPTAPTPPALGMGYPPPPGQILGPSSQQKREQQNVSPIRKSHCYYCYILYNKLKVS